MRFSDEKLDAFYKEFQDLKEQTKEREQKDAEERLAICMALEQNTEALERLSANTEGLIEAWNRGKVILWLVSGTAKWIKILAPIGAVIAGGVYLLKTGSLPGGTPQ